MMFRRKIAPFSGQYRFLSNFYPCPVVHDGHWFTSAEHAYQAAKTLDLEEKKRIIAAATPGQAKRRGHSVTLRSDWEDVKWKIMYDIVMAKFSKNDNLRRKLLQTGSALLVEENTWNDKYWGVSNGVGANHLGQILMRVRQQLRGKK